MYDGEDHAVGQFLLVSSCSSGPLGVELEAGM